MLVISQSNYIATFLANVMQCFQEVQGRPLRLNLASERTTSSPPPVVEENTKSNVDSSELVSSAST